MMNVQSILSFLPEAIVLVVAGKYMVDYKRNDIRLIFIGSLLHIGVRIAYLLMTVFSIMSYDTGSGIASFETFIFISSALTFIGSVIFCIGVLQLMKAVVKPKV